MIKRVVCQTIVVGCVAVSVSIGQSIGQFDRKEVIEKPIEVKKPIYMAVYQQPYVKQVVIEEHTETTPPVQKVNVEPVVTKQAEPIVTKQVEIAPNNSNGISLGICKVTAYCKENYPHICNNGDSRTTATGTTPTAGRTIAVDPSVIPYGSEVVINGHTYIAEDCGGGVKGNRVDICFNTHQEALNFGFQYLEVTYKRR